MKTSFETLSYIPLYQEKWEKNFIYLLVNDWDDHLDTILPKPVHEIMERSILQNVWVLDLNVWVLDLNVEKTHPIFHSQMRL